MSIIIHDGGPRLVFSHSHGERELLVLLAPEEPVQLVDVPPVKK